MSDQQTDHSCRALSELDGLDVGSLHRLIVGRDDRPTIVSPADLDDPFAQHALAAQPFPATADDVIARIRAALPSGDPRGLERSFLVGEGSQFPVRALPLASRSMRFVVALGTASVDVIVSSFRPNSTSVEVMAWDASSKGFNYYRTTRTGAWVFGGNSADAFRPNTEGKGPFESHTSGSMLMKELRFPWLHWHSPISGAVRIDMAIFEGSLGDHRWTREVGDGDGTLHGAEICETQVVMESIRRWTNAHLQAISAGAEPLRPRRHLEQVLTAPTVNLVTSPARGDLSLQSDIAVPAQFFLDSESLTNPDDGLGLVAPPQLAIKAADYADVLAEFNVRLDDGQDTTKPGDTFFAFAVPERAFEDIVATKALAGVLVNERLIGSMLMVDFPNPLFSPLREELLASVPIDGDMSTEPDDRSEEIAERISAAPDTPARRQFLATWDAGQTWQDAANQRLGRYYELLQQRLSADPAGAARDWFLLAESRRRAAVVTRRMPIFEFPFLLASADVPHDRFVMREDATVEAI